MTLPESLAPRRIVDLSPADVDWLATIVRFADPADAPIAAAKLAYAITAHHGRATALRFLDALQPHPAGR